MVSLMLSVNLFTLFFQSVLSAEKCPFCADLKRECDNQKNPLTMDCQTLAVENKPAEDFWKQPQHLKKMFHVMDEYRNNTKKTLRCVEVNYHLQPADPPDDPNDPSFFTIAPTKVKIDVKEKYTFKSCMLESENETACEILSDFAETAEVKAVIDNCYYLEPSKVNGASVSTFSDRLIVFVIFMVLLKLFV